MKHLKFDKTKIAIISAILSAVLYAICIPCVKTISPYVASATTGALLYLGAGFGLFISYIFKKNKKIILLSKQDLPYTSSMIILDILAIILLMFGIKYTNSANVSLLGNFELVATSAVAFFLFKGSVSKKLMTAIILITLASIILSFESKESLVFNIGSLFVILSCVCWGIENNCTRMISNKDTRQITMIKGIFSGLGSVIIAFFLKESIPEVKWIIIILLLGCISYGISVCLYIYAQRYLGATKTGALYSITPFAGALFSILFLREQPIFQFYIALFIMILGTILVIKDSFEHYNP